MRLFLKKYRIEAEGKGMSMRWTTVSDRDFTLMRDEFGNYSHAADKTPISFQEQKKILGNRIKRLRLYREMTQEEAAERQESMRPCGGIMNMV